MSDFEVMLQKKKSEQTRRRRRKDIDIINDNDDMIAQLITEMRNAAEVSFFLHCYNYTLVSRVYYKFKPEKKLML